MTNMTNEPKLKTKEELEQIKNGWYCYSFEVDNER